MRCLVVVQDEVWAVLCSLTNKTQDLNHIAGARVYISLLPACTSIIFSCRMKLTASNLTHRHHPELSRHHVICTKQRLSFQHTPDNLPNFVRSLWASFRSVELFYNANASDLGSFSTRSVPTKGHL
jgi:hypothetical protein